MAYENEDVQIVERDITDVVVPQTSGGLLSAESENIFYLADRADEYVAKMKKIINAALQITTERDWCLVGKTVYLQETGAAKVARLFGISIQLLGSPSVEVDSKGYKTFTYRARFILPGQFVEAEGSRSMRDEFFSGKGCTKKPDEIDERDVRQSAYTNCVNVGIKKLIPGLRGLTLKDLENAGFDTSEISGYSFKTGSRGGNSGRAEDSGHVCSACGAAITNAEAAYSESKYNAKLCRTCQKGARV